MSTIDRIATAQQSAYFLNQINAAGAALDKTNAQIARQGRQHLCRFRQPGPGAAGHHLGQRPQQRLHHGHHAGHHPGGHAGHPADQPVRPCDPAADGGLQRGGQQRSLHPDDPGAEHLRPGHRHPEFQGCQWRLYLWRRQHQHAAGLRDLAVAVDGAGLRFRAPSPMAATEIGTGRRWPDRHLWRHGIRRRHRV